MYSYFTNEILQRITVGGITGSFLKKGIQLTYIQHIKVKNILDRGASFSFIINSTTEKYS